MERFRVGILGAGHIAVKMARTLRGMEGVEPYAIASRDGAKAAAFAREHGFTRSYGSYGELAADPDVDLVYIATPHSHHYPQARMCLECGKPVLCEKAFTANAAEAEALIRLSERQGLFLGEAIWTRYMPFTTTVADLVRNGVVGRAQMLTANLGYAIADKERIVRPELCGGALLDLGVYPINFAFALFGTEVESVASSCVKGPSGVDMQESITFRYGDGRMAVLSATACCATDRQGIVSGDGGYLVVDNINDSCTAEVYDISHRLVARHVCPPKLTGFEYEVASAVEAIRAGRCEPREMPHAETLRVMRLLDSLRAAWGVRYPQDGLEHLSTLGL